MRTSEDLVADPTRNRGPHLLLEARADRKGARLEAGEDGVHLSGFACHVRMSGKIIGQEPLILLRELLAASLDRELKCPKAL